MIAKICARPSSSNHYCIEWGYQRPQNDLFPSWFSFQTKRGSRKKGQKIATVTSDLLCSKSCSLSPPLIWCQKEKIDTTWIGSGARKNLIYDHMKDESEKQRGAKATWRWQSWEEMMILSGKRYIRNGVRHKEDFTCLRLCSKISTEQRRWWGFLFHTSSPIILIISL